MGLYHVPHLAKLAQDDVQLWTGHGQEDALIFGGDTQGAFLGIEAKSDGAHDVPLILFEGPVSCLTQRGAPL